MKLYTSNVVRCVFAFAMVGLFATPLTAKVKQFRSGTSGGNVTNINPTVGRNPFQPVPVSVAAGGQSFSSVTSFSFTTNGSFYMWSNGTTNSLVFTIPTAAGNISRLSVRILANHQHFGDESLTLVKRDSAGNPAGSVVLQNERVAAALSVNNFNNADNQDVTFTTLASVPIVNAYTTFPQRTSTNVVAGVTNFFDDNRVIGEFLPDGSMSTFSNANAGSGTWALVSTGDGAGVHSGNITSFSMTIEFTSGGGGVISSGGGFIRVPRFISETPSFVNRSPRSAGEP